MCTDAASFQIRSSSISKCSEQIATVAQLAANSSAFLESYEISKDTINLLQGLLTLEDSTTKLTRVGIFTKFSDNVMKLHIPESRKGVIKPGEFIFELFKTY